MSGVEGEMQDAAAVRCSNIQYSVIASCGGRVPRVSSGIT
jgi:hypothetical protein